MRSILDTALAEASDHYWSGRDTQAEECFRRILLDHPDHLPTWVNLGAVLRTRRLLQDSAACYRRALALEPGRFEALANMGVLCHQAGEPALAERLLRRAICIKPAVALVRSRLGVALRDLGHCAAAMAALDPATALKPDLQEVYLYRGNVLQTTGDLSGALASFRRAIQVAPNSASAWNNLGGTLTLTGDFVGARDCFRTALRYNPGYYEAFSNLLMALNYDPGVGESELHAEHRRFGDSLAKHLPAASVPYANAAIPLRPLRVGYVSADFGRHPTGYFLQPVLEAHDRQSVVPYCYSGRITEDDLTKRLRDHAATWRSVVGMDDSAMAELIRNDGIDVLVDLSGHTAGNRLPVFHLAPAPVQVSWLGYFNTTGVAAIRAILMDEATVPSGCERWFTEEVIRLPGGRFCYTPPEYAPEVANSPLCRLGHPTFGSFNNLAKLTAPTVRLWSALLQQVGDARLVLKWKSLADAGIRRGVLDAFAAEGIDVRRIELRPASPHTTMLAEYGDIDIALDPIPFGGGLTSYEAMWMGVPVVTLPGVRPVSRQTAALLHALGLDALACDSSERFLYTAADLAADATRLAELRSTLRGRMASSPVCDGPAFTRNLEAAYRDLWGRWCAAG